MCNVGLGSGSLPESQDKPQAKAAPSAFFLRNHPVLTWALVRSVPTHTDICEEAQPRILALALQCFTSAPGKGRKGMDQLSPGASVSRTLMNPSLTSDL